MKTKNNSGFTRLNFTAKNFGGFTIVELLVVIVVIGILAAITIISYTGISKKAEISSLQSDLSNGSKKLKMYQVEYGSFPQTMTIDGNGNYCPTPTDTKYCIKTTSGNTYSYSSTTPYQNFIMDTINTDSAIKYRITNDSAPVSAMPTDTITIGTQTWMKYNLDVGSMITGATNQTNNSVVEKYCYDNDPVNCTIYGGLYQWDEAMQYVITPGTQGICPSSFHIPTDNEYKTLEMYLGMTQIQADDTQERGTNQGTQLKIGGTSGFDGLFGGSRWSDSTFKYMNIHYGYFWTSSEYDLINPWSWYRIINSNPQIIRIDTGVQSFGFSVRCLKN